MKVIIKKILPEFIFKKILKIKEYILILKFKKVHPDTKIFNKPRSLLYSQENQDYIIYENFFKFKKNGIYCDIGGNHPLNMNNTRYFEESGWGGYAFEPLPGMQRLWEKERTAHFFPYAVSDKNGEVVFSIVKNSTGWEDMLSYVRDTRKINCSHNVENITVKTRRLDDVFSEEGINYIDYMSIDVEGHELNVLKGIDFSKMKINVLTVENNSPGYRTNGDEKIRKLMFENNYSLWGRIVGLDDIYVHKKFYYEHIETEL